MILGLEKWEGLLLNFQLRKADNSMEEDKNIGKKQVLYVCLYVAAIFVIVFLINGFLIAPTKVVGTSMLNTLADGDVLMVDKVTYDFREPKRFEIVVFPYQYNKSTNFVKRIIGLPGEKVEIKDFKIYINDVLLDEYYGIYDEEAQNRISNYGPVTLAADEYFVMGDNRDHSDDSRSVDVGVVKEDNIIGRAIFRIYPFNGFGSLKDQ